MLGRWAIEAISDVGASIKHLDGWELASEVPLDELGLLE